MFVIPFLLFAGYAGQIADRFSKTRVLQITKAFEMVIMLVGIVALLARSIDMLLVVLFLLAVQANFFSPAKYGILPEMLRRSATDAGQRPAGAVHVRGHRGGHQLRDVSVRALEGRAADDGRDAAGNRDGRVAGQPVHPQGSRVGLARAVSLESVPRSLDGHEALRGDAPCG